MTDHKNEAIDRLEMVYLGGATDSERANGIATAQVHATLYIAEQQRIANLIALARLESENSSTPTNAIDALWDPKAVGFEVRLRTTAAIREGLGLA